MEKFCFYYEHTYNYKDVNDHFLGSDKSDNTSDTKSEGGLA